MDNNQEIKQELKEVAPLLASLRKPTPPEAPESYFVSFQESLIDKIRKEEVAMELQVVSPVLAQLKKPAMVEAPADYFSSFPDAIIKQVSKPATTEVSWRESLESAVANVLDRLFVPRLSVAFAGFATLFLVAVMFFWKVDQCASFECKLAEVTSEDLNQYIAA